MSPPSCTKQKGDEETHGEIENVSTDSKETKHQAQTNTDSHQVHYEETGEIVDSQGEAARSERWSSVAEPHTSFQQAEDDFPALRLAHENPGGAEEDASLTQIGAVFSTQSSASDRVRSTTSQNLQQPHQNCISSHNRPRDGPLRPAHPQNGSS